MLSRNLKTIEKLWPTLSTLLSIPHNEKEYLNLSHKLDELIDEVGNNEKHPLSSLMETVGLLIEKYEEIHYPLEDVNGIIALKEIMKDQNMKQSDLSAIGSQGIVSEILNGKRELNVRQIKILSKQFSVSPSVFI